MSINNNPITYVSTDFTSLVSQLQQNLLANQSSWKDMYRSGTGQMLIELFAAVGVLVNYYIQRRSEELYLPSAQLYSSVVNLVRLLNYTPSRNISSTGSLLFTLNSPATNIVYIPQYTSCSTSTGVNFLTVGGEATIQVKGTTATVPAIQGTLVNVTNTSNGIANQIYNINDTTIENSIQLELISTTSIYSIAQTLQGLYSNSYIVTNPDGSYSVWAPINPTRPQTLFVSVGGVQWTGVVSFANSISTSTQL